MIFAKLTKPLRDLVPLLLCCAMIVSGISASAETPDFSDLSRQIRQRADSVDRLRDALGRHHIQLGEPLYGLARIQLSANRFEEAMLASEIYLAAWSAKYEETADFSAALERIEQFALERGLNHGQVNKVLQKINHVTPLRLVLNFGILKQSVQASGD
ncbi:MAG: hypothetical protein CMQ16_10795 [Gammaproteobacteria bacterium]|nr:hypothetical protein [Gammaproteobacteria bacterium]